MARISIYDCMVRVDKESPYVWVAYQRESPNLPIAIGGTSEDLAKMIGKTANTIESYVSRYRRGLIKKRTPLYDRVYTGVV
jgi:hypothetical protein